jgi:formate dehydrogenase subunit gamma
MWNGTVDLNWAKQHHSAWFEEESVKAQSSAPDGKVAPAE